MDAGIEVKVEPYDGSYALAAEELSAAGDTLLRTRSPDEKLRQIRRRLESTDAAERVPSYAESFHGGKVTFGKENPTLATNYVWYYVLATRIWPSATLPSE